MKSKGRGGKDIVVLGLGNPLMSDEGIGGQIIERFAAESQKYPSVDFIDAGTGGMVILHLIDGRRKVVFVDCAYMGAKAGTIKKFSPDEVKSVKKLAHYSLHEADVLKIIDIAKQLNQCPQEIVIFSIEPESIEPGRQPGKILSARMDDYIAVIAEELNRQ